MSIDFMISLPKTARGHTAIMVVVDRLSKMAHFIPTRDTVTGPEVARLFVDNIYKLHGMPRDIVSDRDTKFTAGFWSTFFKILGTKLNMSSARHPESDGQTERTIQTLEEYLQHMCNIIRKIGT